MTGRSFSLTPGSLDSSTIFVPCVVATFTLPCKNIMNLNFSGGGTVSLGMFYRGALCWQAFYFCDHVQLVAGI